MIIKCIVTGDLFRATCPSTNLHQNGVVHDLTDRLDNGWRIETRRLRNGESGAQRLHVLGRGARDAEYLLLLIGNDRATACCDRARIVRRNLSDCVS